MKKWSCLKREYILDEKWLKLRRDTVKIGDDVIPDYYVVEKKDVALIVAVDSEYRVIVKREYRYPIDAFLVELPGGTLEPSESPLETAKRELLEETGYVSDTFEKIGVLYDYPTKDTNRIFVFLAKHIRQVDDQRLEKTEEIEISLVPLRDALDMARRNEINVSGSVAALFLALTRIKTDMDI